MVLLEASGLSFSYRGTQGILPILDGVDLQVEKGEILAVLGPSGCGKSTLLKLMSGFLRPEGGGITYKGEPVSGPFPTGQMIFQDSGQLMPWLNVERNIRFSATGKKGADLPHRDVYERILSMTGLESFCRFYPHQLSGGLKQRTALARALYAEPQILFMDEPFASLDAPSRAELQQLLLRIWKEEGLTVLFVTHDISEALLISDRILVFPGQGGGIEIRNNPLTRPRDRDNEGFIAEKLGIYSLIDTL